MRAVLLCAIVAYANAQTTFTQYNTDSTCTTGNTYTKYGSNSCICWSASGACGSTDYTSWSFVCHGNYVTYTQQSNCNSDCSSCSGSTTTADWTSSQWAAIKTGTCFDDGGTYTKVASGCDWIAGVCTDVDSSCPADNNHTASILVGVLGIVCLCACGIGLHASSRNFYEGEHEKSVEAAIQDDVGPAEGDMAVVVDEVVEETVAPDGEVAVVEEEVVVVEP